MVVALQGPVDGEVFLDDPRAERDRGYRETALLLGALLRLVLPREIAGLLTLRRRWVDVVVMAGMGTAVAVLALVVPPSR